MSCLKKKFPDTEVRDIGGIGCRTVCKTYLPQIGSQSRDLVAKWKDIVTKEEETEEVEEGGREEEGGGREVTNFTMNWNHIKYVCEYEIRSLKTSILGKWGRQC